MHPNFFFKKVKNYAKYSLREFKTVYYKLFTASKSLSALLGGVVKSFGPWAGCIGTGYFSDRSDVLLGNEGELSDAGVVPDGVSQCQNVAAVHLWVRLVTGGEVQQLEGVTDPLRLRTQNRTADHAHDTVVKDDPVRLLSKREMENKRKLPSLEEWYWVQSLKHMCHSKARQGRGSKCSF